PGAARGHRGLTLRRLRRGEPAGHRLCRCAGLLGAARLRGRLAARGTVPAPAAHQRLPGRIVSSSASVRACDARVPRPRDARAHRAAQGARVADVNDRLERVRTATARLSNCTASFVSPDGLMLTNHHCAEGCLDEHSSPQHNLLHSGFLARTRAEELKCGTQVADVLMDMEEVTAAVQAAIRGLDARSANDTRKKTLTQLEQTCEQQR